MAEDHQKSGPMLQTEEVYGVGVSSCRVLTVKGCRCVKAHCLSVATMKDKTNRQCNVDAYKSRTIIIGCLCLSSSGCGLTGVTLMASSFLGCGAEPTRRPPLSLVSSRLAILNISETSCSSRNCSMVIQNQSLTDECEALNAIYGDSTVEPRESSGGETTAVLKLPDVPISFLLSFPQDYPDAPPTVRGTNSTGSGGRGEGEKAVAILLTALGSVYQPSQVCLFDLVEEAGPQLQEHNHDTTQNSAEDTTSRSGSLMPDGQVEVALTSDPAPSMPAPSWVTTDSTIVNKSSFVARTLRVSSMTDVTDAVSHLISTNKKVAGATHNIKAWRIRNEETGAGVVQDYDDDGETAAGGRLLHLMQLMDVWNVLVVVTRWYGGVKLGPDRFRVINNVAREALVNGGFAKEEKGKTKKDKK